MKGIILAGGAGTRLHPMTCVNSKQLMPIYDKPMIYYPLSTLMMAGIREVLIISTPQDISRFQQLLKDGSQLGMYFSYEVQKEPNGLAQAFVIGKHFIQKSSVCLILGDNLFHGHGLSERLRRCTQLESGAVIFGYRVNDPQRYGVVEFDRDGGVISIEEKPSDPKSHYAVPGIYFYDQEVVSIAEQLQPSSRGEYEITDINLEYLKRGSLRVERFERGFAWLDTGTANSLLQACNYVQVIQERQGLKIACLEEIAFRAGYINENQLVQTAHTMKNSDYGQYLLQLLENDYSSRKGFFFAAGS